MTLQTQNQNSPSIWQWKNTAHITKTTMEFGFAIAAILMAGTAIYTAAKGVALSSALPAFFANPWVIAAIASYVAIYLVARSISSYQQMHSMEGAKGQDGTSGVNGNNADFSALLGDAIIKSGTISVEKDGEADKLFLKLSIDDYKALAGDDKKAVHVLLAGKEVALERVVPADGATEYKVKVTGVNKVSQPADMKKELGMTEGVNSLTVRVSNQDYDTLNDQISAKLADVAIEGAVKKATGK